jgi:hypothetical protein
MQCNRLAITLQPEIAAQMLHKRFDIAAQSTNNRYATAAQSLCKRYAISLHLSKTLCIRLTIALKSICNCCTIAARSLAGFWILYAIGTQSLRDQGAAKNPHGN